jgi:hypothetical protein
MRSRNASMDWRPHSTRVRVLPFQSAFQPSDTGVVTHIASASIGQRDVISPELALVDPALAHRARLSLAPTLAFMERPPAASRVLVVVGQDPSAHGESTRKKTILAASAVLLVAALAAGVHIRTDQRDGPAAVAGAVPSSTDVREPLHIARTSSPSLPHLPRRLAWAPVPGAGSYQVELFRGGTKVFDEHRTTPFVEIPSQWVSDDGTSHRLRSGQYWWYVWPVSDAGRGQRAVVQARLVIPDS